MPEGRPLRYRDLVNRLKAFGVVEKIGKGSVRMLFKPDVEGLRRSYPIHPHSEHHEFGPPIIRAILRRFKIPEDSFWEGL
jgi:predicted RNA binding protein YcfA (HicA-like mRNA interferase family)